MRETHLYKIGQKKKKKTTLYISKFREKISDNFREMQILNNFSSVMFNAIKREMSFFFFAQVKPRELLGDRSVGNEALLCVNRDRLSDRTRYSVTEATENFERQDTCLARRAAYSLHPKAIFRTSCSSRG